MLNTFEAAASSTAGSYHDLQTHINLEDGMGVLDVLEAIGILLGGIGLFFVGIGSLYWMSTQEEKKKENS